MKTITFTDTAKTKHKIKIDRDGADNLIYKIMKAFDLKGTVFGRDDLEELLVEGSLTDYQFEKFTQDFYDDVMRLFDDFSLEA